MVNVHYIILWGVWTYVQRLLHLIEGSTCLLYSNTRSIFLVELGS